MVKTKPKYKWKKDKKSGEYLNEHRRTRDEQKYLDLLESEGNVNQSPYKVEDLEDLKSRLEPSHAKLEKEANEYGVHLRKEQKLLEQKEVEKENQLSDEEKEKRTNLILKSFKKSVQPHEIAIKVTDPKEKSIQGYFSQITHNFFIGAKAIVFMCRDIANAKNTLTANDYEKLKTSLVPFLSRTTVSKYEKVGECDKLYELLNKNLLPLQWTTQYELAKMKDDDWNKVKSHLTPAITMNQIKDIIDEGKDNGDDEGKVNHSYEYGIDKPKDFIRIAVTKGKEDSDKMLELSNRIQQLVNEVTGVSVNGSTFKFYDSDTNYSYIESITAQEVLASELSKEQEVA